MEYEIKNSQGEMVFKKVSKITLVTSGLALELSEEMLLKMLPQLDTFKIKTHHFKDYSLVYENYTKKNRHGDIDSLTIFYSLDNKEEK